MKPEETENRLSRTEHSLDRLTDITRPAEDQQHLDENQQNTWKAIDTLAQTMVTISLKLERLLKKPCGAV